MNPISEILESYDNEIEETISHRIGNLSKLSEYKFFPSNKEDFYCNKFTNYDDH